MFMEESYLTDSYCSQNSCLRITFMVYHEFLFLTCYNYMSSCSDYFPRYECLCFTVGKRSGMLLLILVRKVKLLFIAFIRMDNVCMKIESSAVHGMY